MADYIKKIRTSNGDKQIDYEALANLPTIPLVDMSLTNEGAAADAKATGDAINLVNTRVEEKVENPLTGEVGQILEIETVDESGKPKTYKAVNKPSGGGEVTDEQISNAVDNYMTAHPFTETDPTVPDWAKHPEKPRYTAEEVGADASGTAESKVSEHNVSDTAHNDIRLLIDGLTTRLNALADSDDTTLDQMSEVVAYIKSNKSLIDAITTSKVNVSDIIDNLTTNASNKPLSAAQGVALKTMIDGITIPTTLPNPNALTFTGVATGSYDGSSPIEINIPGGGGTDVAVDTTLSVAGQAADAKATGDAISSLYKEISDKQPKGDYALKSEIPSVPVSSVNGKTGVVVLSAEDVGAVAKSYVDSDTYKKSIAEKVPIVKTAEAPVFVNSIEEMTDTSKTYVLIDDFNYYAYKKKTITTEGSTTPNFTNVLDDSSSQVLKGQRYSSSGGGFKADSNYTAFVFKVPNITSGVTIRATYPKFNSSEEHPTYFGTSATTFASGQSATWTVESEGICKATKTISDASYQWCVIHVAHSKVIGSVDDMIITINEPIEYTIVEGGTQVVTEWVNTGVAYNQPADYGDRVIEVETDIEELQNKNAELSNRVTGLEANGGQYPTMYISPNGNDENDGLTPNTPKKTVKACVDIGATKISAKRGIYNEEINLSNIDELEIFPTDNDYTFNASVKRFPPIIFDTSHSIPISSLSTYNSIKKVAYSQQNPAFTYVFTNGLYDKCYSTTHGYYVVLWLITGNIKNDIKLRPVGTIAEVEANVNTFTWVNNTIYLNANLTNVTEIRVPTSYNNAFTVITANKVKLTDVEFNFAGRYNILIENCPNVEMDNCATKYSSNGSGFDLKNVNGTFRNCYASRVHDGYGIGDYGHTTFIDCVAEYCFDDGMSHHRGCTGTVIGGRYEGNVKAGNCPAHGVNVNIYGGLYKDNGLWGIAYYYENTHNPSTGTVQNAIIVGNPKGLVVDTGCTVIALDCKYVNNTKDKEANGTLVEY